MSDAILLDAREFLVALFPGGVDLITGSGSGRGKGKNCADSPGFKPWKEALRSASQDLETNFFLASLESPDFAGRSSCRTSLDWTAGGTRPYTVCGDCCR